MSHEELDQLDEVKATGEESEANDPVAPEGGSPKKNRKGDKEAGEKTAPKAGMKEAVDAMFAGDDLSEEFKEKATVVFEAAVNAKLTEEVAKLEEEFEAKLDEQAELAVNELVEKVDSYLDYVVEQWMEANEVAIEKGIRNEIAESFIEGLRELFVEHSINIPEEDVDVLADITEQLEETEAALNEAKNEAIELRKQLDESKREDAFETIAEGLTDTQSEKLKALTEGLEFGNLDDYTRKVEIIKENYFGDSKKVELTEEVGEIDPIEEGTTEVSVDPTVARYADAISRTLRK
jgi:hypothetical protein